MCLFTRGRLCDAGVSPACRTRMSVLHNLVRNHSLNFGCVGVADQRPGTQLALTLFVLRGQDVAQISFMALHLSCPSLLKALGRAFVCF
jgi:hypothetical protein